jgi:hypothetical protein
MRALLSVLVLAAASCSADPVATDVPAVSDAVDIVLPDAPGPVDAGGAQPCTAGRIEECPCGDGRRGMQTCQPSGVYGPCVCADAGSPMDVVVAADVVDAPAARDAVDVVAVPDCGDFYTYCPMGDAGPDQSCINLADGNRRGQIALVNTNCGACGRSCPGGTACCGGRCFAPDASLSGTGISNCARIP